MKTISIVFNCLTLMFLCNIGYCNNTTAEQSINLNQINLNVSSSPELLTLATNWIDEYSKANPGIKVNFRNLSDIQGNENNSISLISELSPELMNNKNTWKMEIGHYAVVPIINAKNPLFDQIYLQGIKAEKLITLIKNPEKRNWNSLISGANNLPIHLYILDNEGIKSAISSFAGAGIISSGTLLIGTVEQLLTTVQKDIFAIGFCALTDVRDATTRDFSTSIKLLPIDKNKNGRLDSFENIYTNLAAFTRGVWLGKHPGALCGNIYAIAQSKPADKNTIDFLSWINQNGQKYLNNHGYSHLASIETRANADMFINPEMLVNQTEKPLMARTWVLALLIVAAMVIVLFAILKFLKLRKSTEIDSDIEITPAFDNNSILAPKGLYFDKSHTWAFMEIDGNVKIGLDDFMQHVTGPITRIKMREPGEKIIKGEKILTIMQNGKQLSISSPISGTIQKQNSAVSANSILLNSAPYAEGWIYLIEPKNWLRETQFLFIAEKYKEWLQDEFLRLKDFLAHSIRSNKSVYAHVILQDGGELTDNVLADLGPEVWEDFQTNFIDASR